MPKETSPHLRLGAHDHRLGRAEHDQLPRGPTGGSSGNCQETTGKLTWFGHVTRHDSLFKTILQCTSDDGQRSGCPPGEKPTGRGSSLNRPFCPYTETSPYLLLGAQDQWTGCGARPASLWIRGNLFWQLSRDGNLLSSGMSHATTVSPKPSFKAPWRVGKTVVGRGNAGWTTSKSGHSCPCHNCSQGPPAEKTGRGSLLNRPSCPPDDPIGQETGLN